MVDKMVVQWDEKMAEWMVGLWVDLRVVTKAATKAGR
jgi:hypothetical protein